MAKFHINNNGEPKTCHAKVRCRFGGASGTENHFSSLKEAEAASQKKLEKIYGSAQGGVKKADLSSDTKAALTKFYRDGVRVQHVGSIAAGNLTKPSATASDVTVMDEKPSKELLASIRRGDFRNSF